MSNTDTDTSTYICQYQYQCLNFCSIMLHAADPIVYLFKACGAKLGWAWGIGSEGLVVVIHMFDTDPKYRMEPSLTDNQYNWQYHNITSCVIHGSGGLVVREADLSARSQVQFLPATRCHWGALSMAVCPQWSHPCWAVIIFQTRGARDCELPRWDSNLGLLITSSILLPLSHGLLLTVVLQID